MLPIHVLPGNHDLREPMRRCFELPGHADEPIQYAVDLGPLRLVVLDTTIPGEDAGALDDERLGWLDAALGQEPDALTVIAMHHPPLVSGVPALDRIALARPDQHALGEVVERHPQVERFVAGHVHRVMAGQLAGRAVLTVPSTYVQTQLDFSLRADRAGGRTGRLRRPRGARRRAELARAAGRPHLIYLTLDGRHANEPSRDEAPSIKLEADRAYVELRDRIVTLQPRARHRAARGRADARAGGRAARRCARPSSGSRSRTWWPCSRAGGRSSPPSRPPTS